MRPNRHEDGAMNRFDEIEAALLMRLRTLKAKPGVTVNMLDMAVPLNAAGYAREELLEVLLALEQEKIVAFGPGNRLLILKTLPQ